MLSIGIPTYNRAHFLESCLLSIAPQISALKGEVELIVSDNCSTDNTCEIVDWARQFCEIKYFKNEENIGPVKNILKIPLELASGTFCWLLGDDDMIREGGVSKIVNAIKENPGLDYFYVNYSIHDFSLREGRVVQASDFQAWEMTGSIRREESHIACWDELIKEDFSGLTPIYCSVFRREKWLNYSSKLILHEPYGNVDSTYPQAVIFLKMMVGKPSWASGYPWVIMCGKESWKEYIPLIILLRFHELLDLMLKFGVDNKIILDHRRRMLNHSGPIIIDMLLRKKYFGLERFSVFKFFIKHWNHGTLWYSLYFDLKKRFANTFKF